MKFSRSWTIPGEIAELSPRAARSLAQPNAARDIVDLIEQAAGITSATQTKTRAANSAASTPIEPAQRNQVAEKVAP